MVSITPDMADYGSAWVYTYYNCSGPKCDNSTVLPLCGFRFTHQPSPWINDYGDFDMMPLPSTYDPKNAPTRSYILKNKFGAFSHANETSESYYYSVQLNNGIQTEYTATRRAGFFQFGFVNTTNQFISIPLSA